MAEGSSSSLRSVVTAAVTATAASFAASTTVTTTASYPGATPPPPGVTPNLENPSDQGHNANIAGLTVCITFASFFYFIRVYVKLWITKRIFLEDVMCLISWIILVLYTATIFMMTRYGEGYHTWDISPHNFSEMLRWLYASSLLYTFGAFTTKVTLLLLIGRVFTIRTGVTRGVHLFILFLIIAYTPIQILKIRVCTPIRAYWDSSINGKCLDQPKLFITDISLAIFTDLVILIIPIPLTWGMTAPWKKKLKIMLLLGAGGIATGVTIFRLVKAIQFIHSKDIAADFVGLDLLTIAELTIGLICSCLPSVNILMEHYKTSKYSRNSPRTRHTPGRTSSRFTWGGLGTNAPGETVDEDTSTSGTKSTSAAEQPPIPNRTTSGRWVKPRDREGLDMELAMYPCHPLHVSPFEER